MPALALNTGPINLSQGFPTRTASRRSAEVRSEVVHRCFRLDPDELRDAVTDNARPLLINTPHNPSGTVLTREELTVIAGPAVERDLLVVTDEVYEHLVFGGAEHIPLAAPPGMRGRTVPIGSAGKTFSFTGWMAGRVKAR